jgi:membrane protein
MAPDDPDQPKFLASYRKLARERIHHSMGAVWAGRVVAFGQFWELVITGFVVNRCPVRATALAYTTLLALIPMLAVVASVSTAVLKSQGREPIDKAVNMLVAQILPNLGVSSTNATEQAATKSTVTALPGTAASTNRFEISADAKLVAADTLEKNKAQIVNSINEALQKIQSGSLGVTGMIGLIVVAIMLFSTIETTFNDIWGVRHGRSWVSRIVQYWATVTLGPLIPFAVLSLGIGSRLKVDDLVEGLWFHKFLTEDFLPVLILSLGFSFFYQLMPNTRVRWMAAFVGGIAAGCLWHLNSYLSVIFVAKAANFANIYGGLAMIPIFLAGLYVSWLILLFGAQVAYAFQNRVAYLQEKEAQQINFLGRQYMALRIMTVLGQRFNDGTGKAPGIIEISQLLRVSTRLVDQVLKAVRTGGLVMETTGDDIGYTLARPLDKISCHDILMAMRMSNGNMATSSSDYAKAVVDDVFARVLKAERTVSEATSLNSLVEQLGETAEQDSANQGANLSPQTA